jgi:hypothetical protein
MVSWAAVSAGEVAGGAGVGCSLGFGTATARGGADAASSAFDAGGDGRAVLAGSLSTDFLGGDFPFTALLPDPPFFFFCFDPGDGVLDGFGVAFEDALAGGFSSSSSASDDFFFFAAELFGFGVGESSSSSLDFDFDGAFFAAGVGLLFFFFFGEALGLADGEAW